MEKINDEKIGQRAFAPYEFKIPDKFSGQKVHCKLIFHSSYAPLFGDSEKLKEMPEKAIEYYVLYTGIESDEKMLKIVREKIKELEDGIKK